MFRVSGLWGFRGIRGVGVSWYKGCWGFGDKETQKTSPEADGSTGTRGTRATSYDAPSTAQGGDQPCTVVFYLRLPEATFL